MQQGQMQSPDHGKEEILATTQTGHLLAGELLYRKGPGNHGIESKVSMSQQYTMTEKG